MKKIFAIVAVSAFLFASCGTKNTEAVEETTEPQTEEVVVEEATEESTEATEAECTEENAEVAEVPAE